MVVHILRLSHRAARDKRVTTHLGLVSRAFGAEKMIITGAKDSHIDNSIQRVVDSWGGDFKLEYSPSWQETFEQYKKKKFTIVHLTMYGLRVLDKIEEIKKSKDLLVVVGGEKVPFELYQQADYNIAVTSQPHSEISALSVFLDRYFDGSELSKDFSNPKIKVEPDACGKQILHK